jgi:microcystin-dependent protein
MRGRTAIGTGQGDTWSGIGGATNWLLGQKFGAERHQMSIAEMPSHNHGVNDPGHSHLMTVSAFIHGNFHATNQGSLSQTNINGHSPRTEHVTTGISIQNRGNDQPHNNMQPSLVLNYIIKL